MTPEHQQAEREALLPCPFCNGNPYLDQNEGYVWWQVVCTSCGSSGMEHGKKSEAIAAWNRRAGERADVVPPGMVLVPIELTEEMHAAAVRTVVRCTGNDDFPPRVWRAMVAASQDSREGK